MSRGRLSTGEPYGPETMKVFRSPAFRRNGSTAHFCRLKAGLHAFSKEEL